MPDNYPVEAGLYWDNFYYVTPGMWKGEGRGFLVDPMTRHNSVAFIGGTQCSLAYTCHGSIKLQMVPNATATFTPISMSLSAGWMPNNVTVIGYSHSKFVGRLTWKLTITAHTYTFPHAWNDVTQLVFIPEVNAGHAMPVGSMVIYSFVLMKH